MNVSTTPVLVPPREVSDTFDSICSQPNALENVERLAGENSLDKLSFVDSDEWQDFSRTVRATLTERDQVLIKGMPPRANGATLLLTAFSVASAFRTYRGGKIVKHFKMSPWTTELSHTTREGEFHTDLNTESSPPAVTAMQCLDPDPGAPKFGINRVARLADLISFLKTSEDNKTLDFLTKEKVIMLNDYSSSFWSGRVIEGHMIRYHPETLRAAARRKGQSISALEERMTKVAKAAFAVSQPLIMSRGDILLFSNHRTLHYRGECSVVFKSFPTDFESRSVFVLHATEDLTS